MLTMLTVYNLEQPTKGKMVLKMMMRPINIELWPTEAPKAFRNFVHFCLEGYYHRNLSMGMNLYNISKMLRCTSIDDVITLKVDDGSDAVIFMFDSPNQDKITDFEMKLMDINNKLTVLKDSTGRNIEARKELRQKLSREEFGVTYLYTNGSTDKSLAYKSILKKKLRTVVDIEDEHQ